MSNLSLRLPETLHKQVRELAKQEGISVNQFIMVAVAEKTSSLLTLNYLERRAQRGSLESFQQLLEKVPDVPPLEGDEWEE